MSSLTVYTRAGCHLCAQALEEIRGMRDELAPFELREVDIDSDDDLLRAYLERIPVVEVDGELVSELRLNAGAVRAAVGSADA